MQTRKIFAMPLLLAALCIGATSASAMTAPADSLSKAKQAAALTHQYVKFLRQTATNQVKPVAAKQADHASITRDSATVDMTKYANVDGTSGAQKKAKKVKKDAGKYFAVSKKSGKQYTYYCCEFTNNRGGAATCDFMTWDVPVKDDCPACGHTMFKKSGKGFKRPYCINPECENFVPEDKRGYTRKSAAADQTQAAEPEKQEAEQKAKGAAEPTTAKKSTAAKPTTAKKSAAAKSTTAKKTTTAAKTAKRTSTRAKAVDVSADDFDDEA